MHKVRPVKWKECEKVALYLGFEFKKQKSSHRHYKKHGVGKTTVPVYCEISGDLFSNICKQLNITKIKFFEILADS